MKYILLIYGAEQVWGSMSKEEMEKIYTAHRAFRDDMDAAGVYRSGSELSPVSEAKSVRFTSGKPQIADGPFAETKEQLAGYYVIEVGKPEQASYWASRMPGMSTGTVEIRPLR